MFRFSALLVSFLLAPVSVADTPRVLVTIKPYHSLVSLLLDDITRPALLLDGYQSPHTFRLKPYDTQTIAEADIIIWAGPTLETPLAPRLRKANDQHIIQIADGHDNEAHHQHETDPHRWLDPVLTINDMERIAEQLITAYPQHRKHISTMLKQVTTQLKKLDNDIRIILGDQKKVSALLYHAAWNYFLKRYDLEVNGVIHNSEHQPPGARHLHHLSEIVKNEKPRCLMIEPQFKPKYISAIAGDHEFKQHLLDPLGADITAGTEMYVSMMHAIARTFAKCR